MAGFGHREPIGVAGAVSTEIDQLVRDGKTREYEDREDQAIEEPAVLHPVMLTDDVN